MRIACAALIGLTVFLGACGGGGGGGDGDSSGDGEVHTVPFDEENAPQNPPPTDPQGGEPFTYRILFEWAGYETTQQTLVARNEAEYKAITDRCSIQYGDWGDPPPGWTPPVDFDTEIVVAVFLGTVPGRRRVGIENITPAGDGANLRWVHYVPGPGWPQDDPSVTTRPYALAAMTRVEGPVTFTGRTEIVPYDP